MPSRPDCNPVQYHEPKAGADGTVQASADDVVVVTVVIVVVDVDDPEHAGGPE